MHSFKFHEFLCSFSPDIRKRTKKGAEISGQSGKKAMRFFWSGPLRERFLFHENCYFSRFVSATGVFFK